MIAALLLAATISQPTCTADAIDKAYRFRVDMRPTYGTSYDYVRCQDYDQFKAAKCDGCTFAEYLSLRGFDSPAVQRATLHTEGFVVLGINERGQKTVTGCTVTCFFDVPFQWSGNLEWKKEVVPLDSGRMAAFAEDNHQRSELPTREVAGTGHPDALQSWQLNVLYPPPAPTVAAIRQAFGSGVWLHVSNNGWFVRRGITTATAAEHAAVLRQWADEGYALTEITGGPSSLQLRASNAEVAQWAYGITYSLPAPSRDELLSTFARDDLIVSSTALGVWWCVPSADGGANVGQWKRAGYVVMGVWQ